VSWVPILVFVLVFVVAPILFPVFLGGIVLSSPPRIDAFEDAAFFHGVVGFWMQLAWSLQRLVVVFLVIPPSVGALDRIHLVVVIARALASEIVAVVTAPVPAFSVVPVIGAAMVPVVEAAATVVTPRRLVGTSGVISDEFFCVVGVSIIFGHGEELCHRRWPFAQ
jgi:hypothetical protein